MRTRIDRFKAWTNDLCQKYFQDEYAAPTTWGGRLVLLSVVGLIMSVLWLGEHIIDPVRSFFQRKKQQLNSIPWEVEFFYYAVAVVMLGFLFMNSLPD